MKKKYSMVIFTITIFIFLILTGCAEHRSSKVGEIGEDQKLQKSIIDSTKILDKYPRDRLTLQERALAHLNFGEPEKAFEDYNSITKISKSSTAYANEGHLLLELGRIEEALIAFKKSCELDNDKPAPTGIPGYIICFYGLKKYDEALQTSERYFDELAPFSNSTIAKALSLKELNHKNEALSCVEQICDFSYAPEARLFYLRAQILCQLGKKTEAKRILNIATLCYPETVIMKSGKRMSLLTTPLYADCVEQFLKLENPDRALGTVALANVLGERSLRMTVLEALARAKMNNQENIPKAQKLIETEKQFWKNLKSSSL